MKLYTEEQVINTLQLMGLHIMINEFIKKAAPIELPSDEEIKIKIKLACWFVINDTIHQSGARDEKVWNKSNLKDIKLMNLLDTKTLELTNRIMKILNQNK